MLVESRANRSQVENTWSINCTPRATEVVYMSEQSSTRTSTNIFTHLLSAGFCPLRRPAVMRSVCGCTALAGSWHHRCGGLVRMQSRPAVTGTFLFSHGSHGCSGSSRHHVDTVVMHMLQARGRARSLEYVDTRGISNIAAREALLAFEGSRGLDTTQRIQIKYYDRDK